LHSSSFHTAAASLKPLEHLIHAEAPTTNKGAQRAQIRMTSAALRVAQVGSDLQPCMQALPHLYYAWSQCPAVERVAGKVSGEWLFKGTRVPVKALFEKLEDGARASPTPALYA
jgi:hypothetical protein